MVSISLQVPQFPRLCDTLDATGPFTSIKSEKSSEPEQGSLGHSRGGAS